jgi:hypothetical protein
LFESLLLRANFSMGTVFVTNKKLLYPFLSIFTSFISFWKRNFN